MRSAWTLLLVVLVSGCPSGPVAEPPRGPEGGVFRFDGAMIVWDAGSTDAPVPAVDGGPRPDAPEPGFDAGPRLDAGRDGGPGFDAGRRCTGVARSCSSYGSSSLCVTQEGCRRDGECSGVSRSCYSLYSSYTCTSQDGCYWSTSSDNCSGSARSCYGYASSSSCYGQDGCSWRDTCEGVSSSCFGRSAATCTLQEGCYLE
jgi:hypothetical protein